MAHTRSSESVSAPPAPVVKNRMTISALSGLSAGIFCAVTLNPFDRALYLSMKEHRPLLTGSNFRSPFRGLSQAIAHRTLSHGLYYIFQGELDKKLAPMVSSQQLSGAQAKLLVGLCSGALNGFLLNPVAAIKYQLWASETASVWKTMREKWAGGRWRPFVKGTSATMLRDIIFGCTYEVMRRKDPAHNADPHKKSARELTAEQGVRNTAAATCAVVLSSPLNYARQKIYACPPHSTPPTIAACLRALVAGAAALPSLAQRARFVQIQLAVGAGSVRAGVGMALGQAVFATMEALFTDLARQHH